MGQRAQTGLCINLSGWDREGDGRKFKKEGDIYMYTYDSFSGLTENNNSIKSNYPSIKKQIKKKKKKKNLPKIVRFGVCIFASFFLEYLPHPINTTSHLFIYLFPLQILFCLWAYSHSSLRSLTSKQKFCVNWECNWRSLEMDLQKEWPIIIKLVCILLYI